MTQGLPAVIFSGKKWVEYNLILFFLYACEGWHFYENPKNPDIPRIISGFMWTQFFLLKKCVTITDGKNTGKCNLFVITN